VTLGAPLGLLGLLAIPCIVAIHLYRRRYTPIPVSGLFLFGQVNRSAAAGRTRQPLIQSKSLWCELLATLAVTWFLADPHIGDQETSDHLIVVLDDRASLQAAGGEPPHSTAHARLLEAVTAQLSGLDRDDRVTLVLAGSSPRLLAGPATSARDAITRLDGWRGTARWQSLDAAFALAEQLDRGPDGKPQGARILVATDRVPERLAEGTGLIARGEARPTLGIVDARWLLADARFGERLFVRVAAFGGKTRRGVLSVRAGAVTLGQTPVTLSPNKAAPYFIPVTLPTADVEGRSALDAVTVTLTQPGRPADPWPLDDSVTVIRPAARIVRVYVTPAAAMSPVRRAVGSVDGVTLVATPESADIIIQTGTDAPPARAGAWTMTLAGHDAGEREVIAVGPFLAAHGHPMLAGLDWAGVIWVGARIESDAPSDPDSSEALLMAGSNVLISEARRGRDRDVTLWLSLARSTLIDHPSWPGLFANLIEARRTALPGTGQTNVLLGQPVRVTAPTGAAEVVLVGPGDTAQPLTLVVDADGAIVLPSLEEPGVHRFLLQMDDTPSVTIATVNGMQLDGRLADLGDATTLTKAPSDGTATTVERRRGPLAHTVPLALAALLMLLGWHFFRRPRRVAVTA
jgi:hypothetical protein